MRASVHAGTRILIRISARTNTVKRAILWIILAAGLSLAEFQFAVDRKQPVGTSGPPIGAVPIKPAPSQPAAATSSPAASWRAEVERTTQWALPLGNRIPGVESSRLTDNAEVWISSLPSSQQDQARRFVDSYGTAYQFDSKLVQAWMLAHGFPALEEVIAYDFARMSADCTIITCSHGKIAGLTADHLMNEMQAMLPEQWSGPYLEHIPPGMRNQFIGQHARVMAHIRQTGERGGALFSVYLNARLERLLGNNEGVRLSESLIRACGDQRMLTPNNTSALYILARLPRQQQSCGYPAGLPQFPRD